MTRNTPAPPRPELVRRPRGRFGWLDDHLLHDRWLADVGPDAVAVLVLLALAADARGASFYRRDRMADLLGIDRVRLDDALQHLLEVRLVAHRPWRPRTSEGVWQLLPTPNRKLHQRASRTVSAAELLRQLGFRT